MRLVLTNAIEAPVPLTNDWGIDLWLLPSSQGNKAFKLAGYFAEARRMGKSHLVTMAGAHSNHLRAFAQAINKEGLCGTAIIRGDELVDPRRHSPELQLAQKLGIECIFVGRGRYLEIREGAEPPGVTADSLFIPEGGRGPLGLRGVQNWAAGARGFDAVWLPVATGTTAAGFLLGTKPSVQLTGVAVLRNETSIRETIRLLAPGHEERFSLRAGYGARRFGKPDAGLISFAKQLSADWHRRIDPEYLAPTLRQLVNARPAGRVLMPYTYNE